MGSRGNARRTTEWTVLRFLVHAAAGFALLAAGGALAAPDTPGGGPRSANCVKCHPTDVLFSHPVGVVPNMAVPEHLPLEDGKITCITCHETSVGGVHATGKGRRDALVRAPGSGAMFCLQCHRDGPEGNSISRSAAHGGMLGQAHMRWPQQRWPSLTASRSVAGGVGRLDEESRNCLSCHDGTLAADAAAGGTSILDPQHGHPVGVAYAGAGVRPTRDMPVRPAQLLDRRIRLFEGRVGCGSCHNPYSREEHLLVRSNNRSALCLSCHQG